jgi:hypothetical protein
MAKKGTDDLKKLAVAQANLVTDLSIPGIVTGTEQFK